MKIHPYIKQVDGIRIKNEWSIEKVSDEIGSTAASYYKWMRGDRTPGKMAQKLIKAWLIKNGEVPTR